MDIELWKSVDRYMVESLHAPDPILDEVLIENAHAGLPPHDVSPNQGKLLKLIAQIQGSKRILEIGTLGGYSTIWLARALPDGGSLVTLESDVKHAAVARANIDRAGLSAIVSLRVGPALESMSDLVNEGVAPFDLIFIDADKPNNPGYLEWSLRLARVGTIIVGDNVVRDGSVIDPSAVDPRVQGVRRFFEAIGSDPRLDATAIQTVGSKGYDGFVLAIVRSL